MRVPHPLIFMRGMRFDDLLVIVDFLYHGEANVFQENLDSFLAIAEELQLKGLMGKPDEKDHREDEKFLPSTFSPVNVNIPKTTIQRQTPNRNIHNLGENRTLAIPGNNFEELEEKVKSLMEKSQNKTARGREFAYLCKVCGKEGRDHHIKDHIEANHLEGIIIPCNLCDKTFRYRHSLRDHKSRH